LTAAFLALSLVGACGYEKAGPSPVVAAVGEMAKSSLAKVKAGKKGAQKPAGAQVTRAKLEKAGKPILRVVAESAGQDGFLTISDTKSGVVTWETPNGITFSLRNGVLIQTRGLVGDLMSAQAPTVAQLVSPGDSHQRLYFFLGPDDSITRRTYDCTTESQGRKSIKVMGRSHDVTLISETCTRSNTKITNEYWVEGGSIRKSRQWASALIGYVEFIRVID
jgi:hypothetical protein